MMQNKCNDPNTSLYPPYGQVKFPLKIPNDPRRRCKGNCGKNGETIVKNAPIVKNASRQPAKVSKTQKNDESLTRVHEQPSSDSGLSFIQVENNDNEEHRTIRYQDPPGSSFGVHLLRKSIPLYSHALDEKLQFKRDSDVGNIINQQQRKITQPVFMNQMTFDDKINLRKINVRTNDPTCSPPLQIKTNMVHKEFLTKNNRAKEGLKYIMATNFPHIPPDSLSGNPSIKHEIKDTCGRKTHHPKLRARDLGKCLCEAPSMTKELNHLHKEYIDRCPEGDVRTEACRYLHHAPSPHHRETKRSILKDQHTLSGDDHEQHRKSSGKNLLLRFDKEVDLISTAMTKVDGIDASMRETNKRLKLLRQLGGRITATGTRVNTTYQERHPLHVRHPKQTASQSCPNNWLKISEQEGLEEKTAKQELARIYFTTEATRLMACTNLASLDRNTNVFKKTEVIRRPPFPHFFMDRLASEVETENKRKTEERLAAIKSEMDAFDASVKEKPTMNTMSNFDPLQPSSDKSLNDFKLKVEIMKKQRERDVQSAMRRNRTRKSYFRQMLPCFEDVLGDDLMDYSVNRASKLTSEEMILIEDLLTVAKQRDALEEDRMKYEEEEDELLAEEIEHMPGENDKFIRGILEVCLDAVVKICNYKSTTGNEPPDSLRREWRDVGFSLLNQQFVDDDQILQAEDAICRPEGNSEEDTGSPSQFRISEQSDETGDEMKDASMSGGLDSDDNHVKCVVTLKAVQQLSTAGRSSAEEQPATTTIQVQVTDCLHEDIESALTYDGLILPVTESQLTQSTSETQIESSASRSATPSDSQDESFTDCTNIQQGDTSKQQLGELDYEEYTGEDGEYFDDNGEVVVAVKTESPGRKTKVII